ncbi:caffeoylshikimate esterase [Elaeis guineensis]
MLNRHSMKIFTQTWRPASPSVKLNGIVAMVHGYNSESSWIFQLTAVAIAKLGFLACALDLPGHGHSQGPRGHIPTIGPVIDDCIQFFDSVRSAHGHLPAFLYGESLGGAIAMLVYFKQKSKWDGLILNGAMCGVSTKFKPPWPLEKLLPFVACITPNWRVTVTESLVDRSYKENWKKELVRRSPRAQEFEHPPASTAWEFLKVCEEIGRRCSELELPLLVLHGEEDSVCDSDSAELVYALARSEDKTLEILPGMWHQLIGEPQETVELGFGIIFSWLKDRAKRASLAYSNNY